MSDLFYRVLTFVGRPALWTSGSPLVIGAGNVPRDGAFILAGTHESPFDVAVLIQHTPRLLDFVSIVEVFRHPVVGWLYGSLNAFPLDRSRPDAGAVRIILERLGRGRVIAMFPEGGIRRGEDSVIHSRIIRKGIGRIAKRAGAPIVPCVVIGSGAYAKFSSWLPLRATRYGVIYGKPLPLDLEAAELEARLVEAFVALHARLSDALKDEGSRERGGSQSA